MRAVSRCAFLVMTLTCLMATDVCAQAPVVLTESQDEYPLGLHLSILEDPSGKLTIHDVASPEYLIFRCGRIGNLGAEYIPR